MFVCRENFKVNEISGFSDLNHLPWYRELTVKCVKVWFLKEPVINTAFRTGEAVFILSVTPVSPSIQGEQRPKTLSSSHNHTQHWS